MKTIKISVLLIAVSMILSCTHGNKNKNGEQMDTTKQLTKGTFGYDLEFMKKHKDVIILKDNSGNSQVLLVGDYQGRVMTSTAEGLDGSSFGWINYNFISSGKLGEHMSAFGGEDRFWLGPEGGQFSIFFKKGVKFDFDNWFTPKEIDSEPFELVSKTDSTAFFKKAMSLTNYSGTKFDLLVNRNIKLLGKRDIENILGVKIDESIKSVAFETENIITNTGKDEWKKKTGMLSIWILGMLTPTQKTTVVIPYKMIAMDETVKTLTDDYFGKVPADRLIEKDGIIYFKADGKCRSKIGLSPYIAKPFAGSYDEEKGVLTIVNYTFHEGVTDYVNSLWKIQDDPYGGDVVNSYNDGPQADGTQMGPFYEIESSSPVANLKPGSKMIHYSSTFHFVGDEQKLNVISEKVLGVSIDRIKSMF